MKKDGKITSLRIGGETVPVKETPKTIDWRNILRSMYYVVGIPALGVIYRSIEAGSFAIDWKGAALAGLGGGIIYLIKKGSEPAKIVIKKSDL